MAIAKKIENTSILPNFNTDPFFDIKINPGGLLCFCFVSTMNIYPYIFLWKKLFQFWSLNDTLS